MEASIVEYYKILTNTDFFSKKACTQIRYSKCRKWGSGLPKHIKMLFLIQNIVFILIIIKYTLLVLNMALYIDYIALAVVPSWAD